MHQFNNNDKPKNPPLLKRVLSFFSRSNDSQKPTITRRESQPILRQKPPTPLTRHATGSEIYPATSFIFNQPEQRKDKERSLSESSYVLMPSLPPK